MTGSTLTRSFRAGVIIPSILVVVSLGSPLPGQDFSSRDPYPSFEQAPSSRLSPSELTNLVAPVALYPDPLLSQVLAASTYPQELAEAQQFLEQNAGLEGRQLIDAAKQQNWDPSVQALFAFPEVVALLNRDIQWTSDLGQAFLTQPSDVMDAIQYLRAQARDRGQLPATPELSINTEVQNGQSAIEIHPADPQMMYVPAYNPYAVWGPPAEGSYPALPYQGSGFGSLFESAVNLAGLFAGFPGLLGPNSWGWALSWLAHTLFINNPLLDSLGFRNLGGGYDGPTVWSHNTSGTFGAPYGLNGSNGGRGWRPFGGRHNSWGASRDNFAPQRPRSRPEWSGGGGAFEGSNRAASSGNWRSFRDGARPPFDQSARRFGQRSSSGDREFQASNRFPRSAYPARSESYSANYLGSYRTPFADRRSLPPSYGGFSNYGNETTRSTPRAFRQSSGSWGRQQSSGSWGGRGRESRSFQRASRSFQPRAESRNSYWGSSGSRQSFKAPKAFKPPKQERFKEPHFKEPHFKSHGGGGGGHHSGGKSRHRR